MVDFVPVTAAGPLPISTGFPFKLSHLTANEIVLSVIFLAAAAEHVNIGFRSEGSGAVFDLKIPGGHGVF